MKWSKIVLNSTRIVIFISLTRWQWKKKRRKCLIFSNHFAICFNLIKLVGGEFPYIISSFSILRKVFWGMCRSELFDKSLEKESYWLKEKKMILERSSINFSKRQMFSLHKITCPFPFYLTLEGRCYYPNDHRKRSKSTSS